MHKFQNAKLKQMAHRPHAVRGERAGRYWGNVQLSTSNVLRLKVWETGQAKAPVPLRSEPRYLVCCVLGEVIVASQGCGSGYDGFIHET